MEERNHSLDALRGLAALAAVLTFLVAFHGLPAWMYSAQLDPKSLAVYPELRGLNWPDLILPAFVFCLGLSIPIALSRDPSKRSFPSLLFYILTRTSGLLLLSVVVGHFGKNDISLQALDSLPWVVGGGAILMVLRLPTTYPVPLQVAIRFLGLLIVLYGLIQSPISLEASDPILAALATVFLASALLYIAIKKYAYGWWVLWLLILGFVLAAEGSPTIQDFWGLSPIANLFDVSYLKWLLVTIPAILIAQCPDRESSRENTVYRSLGALFAVIGGCGTLALIFVDQTSSLLIGSAGLCLASMFVLRSEPQERGVSLTGWTLIIFGTLMASVTGPTIANLQSLPYILISGGVCSLGYLAIKFVSHIVRKPEVVRVSQEGYAKYHDQIESIGLEERTRSGYLANVGRNSFLSYLIIAVLATPYLTVQTREKLTQNVDTWQIVVSAFVLTALLGYLIGLLAKARIFVRP